MNLAAARACAYCSRAGELVRDEEGDLVCAPGAGCAASKHHAPVAQTRLASTRARPDHYKVLCVSFYNKDLAHLDDLVRGLKKRGFTKASRSAVLRAAVEQFDPSKITRGL